MGEGCSDSTGATLMLLLAIYIMPQPENMAKTTKANENIKKKTMPNPAHSTSCCFRALLFITDANCITKWITRRKQKQSMSTLTERESTRKASFSLPFNIFSVSRRNPITNEEERREIL